MVYLKYTIIILLSFSISVLLDYIVFWSNTKKINPFGEFYKKYAPIRKKIKYSFIINLILYAIPFIWFFYNMIFYKGNMLYVLFSIISIILSNMIVCLITPSSVIYYMALVEHNGKIDLERAKEKQFMNH